MVISKVSSIIMVIIHAAWLKVITVPMLVYAKLHGMIE